MSRAAPPGHRRNERREGRLHADAGGDGIRAGERRLGGRPKKLGTPTKVAMVKGLYADHTHSIAEICKSLGISRATLYRSLGHPDRRENAAATRLAVNDDK